MMTTPKVVIDHFMHNHRACHSHAAKINVDAAIGMLSSSARAKHSPRFFAESDGTDSRCDCRSSSAAAVAVAETSAFVYESDNREGAIE